MLKKTQYQVFYARQTLALVLNRSELTYFSIGTKLSDHLKQRSKGMNVMKSCFIEGLVSEVCTCQVAQTRRPHLTLVKHEWRH